MSIRVVNIIAFYGIYLHYMCQSALQAQRTNEIRELASFFEGLSGPVITFDESYVRRLFSRITVYDDKVIFAFKDGKEVTIKE